MSTMKYLLLVVTFEGKVVTKNEKGGLRKLPLYRRLGLSYSYIFPDLVYHKQAIPGFIWFKEYKA